MISYIWPVALIVVSNAMYQICAKKLPAGLNSFFALAVMYIICAVICIGIYAFSNKNFEVVEQLSKVNWSVWFLALTSVGLEAGFLLAYQVGWPVSALAIVQSSFLAILLIIIGNLLFQEPITIQKIIGILTCCLGLYFINK